MTDNSPHLFPPEPEDPLIAALAALRPAAPRDALASGIAGALEGGYSRSDRCLLTAIAAGALAACVLLAVVLTGPASPRPAPGNTAAAPPEAPPTLMDYQRALARGELPAPALR